MQASTDRQRPLPCLSWLGWFAAGFLRLVVSSLLEEAPLKRRACPGVEVRRYGRSGRHGECCGTLGEEYAQGLDLLRVRGPRRQHHSREVAAAGRWLEPHAGHCPSVPVFAPVQPPGVVLVPSKGPRYSPAA